MELSAEQFRIFISIFTCKFCCQVCKAFCNYALRFANKLKIHSFFPVSTFDEIIWEIPYLYDSLEHDYATWYDWMYFISDILSFVLSLVVAMAHFECK